MLEFQIHTLHRARFIWFLLGSLFVAGILLSFVSLQEIAKIIILLFCIPVILFSAVKVSYQTSVWKIDEQSLTISRPSENHHFLLEDISYIKNHIRSGGNLLAIHQKKNRKVYRLWRNKLFMGEDHYDQLIHKLKETKVEILQG